MDTFVIFILLLIPFTYSRRSRSSACDYFLSNADFEQGTYKITSSGKYCLTEDIHFNPRSGDIHDPNKYGAWFPTNDHVYPGSTTYQDGGYALGFFSAISIEEGDVEVDLQGFEIAMSKPFYIQQRFYNHIEIQKAAFNSGQGPTAFGETVPKIRNVFIHNGKLGRSSHNGIHGFDVEKVTIEDLQIYDFEVAGLQLNGFKDVTIRSVDIGPSATNVPFWSYYSHGRFSLLGFDLIDEKEKKYVRFKGNRKLTLQQIYNNLRDSLDIAYRHEMGQSTAEDKQHPLYGIALDLYVNPGRLPDGSTLYGMIFNSRGFAVQGYGDSPNEECDDGSKLYIEDVNIHGLKLYLNEMPALYFDRCEGHYYQEDGSTSITPVTGRFGDNFDCRKAMKHDDWDMLDQGFGRINNGYSYSDIKYHGNPIADAQVALGIFSTPFENNWGLRAQGVEQSAGKETFYRWATENGDPKYDSLPTCARLLCNGDAMVHLNKGVIGVRLDGIENTEIKNLKITNLHNASPSASLACGPYKGPNDGGQPNGLEREGAMGTDIKGMSVINGGWLDLSGSIVIDGCVSDHGDVVGVHVMDDAQVYIDEPESFECVHLECGASVSPEKYKQMMDVGIAPYPNNLYECNIKTEQLDDRESGVYPYDGRSDQSTRGYVYPDGSIHAECRELYFDINGERRRRLVVHDTS
eukprot:192953_1